MVLGRGLALRPVLTLRAGLGRSLTLRSGLPLRTALTTSALIGRVIRLLVGPVVAAWLGESDIGKSQQDDSGGCEQQLLERHVDSLVRPSNWQEAIGDQPILMKCARGELVPPNPEGAIQSLCLTGTKGRQVRSGRP